MYKILVLLLTVAALVKLSQITSGWLILVWFVASLAIVNKMFK